MKLKLEHLLIKDSNTLLDAMKTIDVHGSGIGFVVESDHTLIGTITDGDIRRALINNGRINDPVSMYVQKDCTYLPFDTTPSIIQSLLSPKIKFIPLIDGKRKVVDFATYLRFKQIPILEPYLGGKELEYVADCVRTNWISSQGKYVTRFEQMLCELTGSPFCLVVSNGTAALHLALVTLGIGPGDEVIIPNITFAATINAVLYTGATPVIVDVEPTTWNISPKEVEQNITESTKAIIPVHLYGVPCNMDVILRIATQKNITIVEDAAEAIGSVYKGVFCGNIGQMGTFSFFGNKIITTGEGGAILFKDRISFEKAKQHRDHGMSKDKKYWHDVIGFNYRMTNLQAAVGVAQLENFETIIERKQQINRWYKKHLGAHPGIKFQELLRETSSSCWLFTIMINEIQTENQRNEIMKSLASKGIDSRPVFYPLGDMPVYKSYGKGELKQSHLISNKGISLPSHINMNENEIQFISETIQEILVN